VMGLVLFAAVMLVSHLIFWPIKARNWRYFGIFAACLQTTN
jgi:hypothetical protein